MEKHKASIAGLIFLIILATTGLAIAEYREAQPKEKEYHNYNPVGEVSQERLDEWRNLAFRSMKIAQERGEKIDTLREKRVGEEAQRVFAKSGTALPSRAVDRAANRVAEEIAEEEKTKRLDRFLLKTSLAGYGSVFVSAAEKYGINWKLSATIGMCESGCGNSSLARRSNNCWGMKKGCCPGQPVDNKGVYQAFPDFTTAIFCHAEYLARRYNRPQSPYDRMSSYATDPAWEGKVQGHMNKI